MSVSIVNVQFREATLFETTVVVTLRVNNETPDALALDGAVHKIYFDGRLIGTGLSGERLEVPRLASGTQTVSVHLRNITMALRFRSIVESESVEYKVTSDFFTTVEGRKRRHRAVGGGVLNLREFQAGPPAGGSGRRPATSGF
jgi:LEA14-like dessication related protein